MRCAFCGREGTRRELHAHLTDEHADRVVTSRNGWGRRFMQLDCPACDEMYRREVKPRSKDPRFLDEYAREIRIVAFDMFLYHWQDAHEGEVVDG